VKWPRGHRKNARINRRELITVVDAAAWPMAARGAAAGGADDRILGRVHVCELEPLGHGVCAAAARPLEAENCCKAANVASWHLGDYCIAA